MAETVPVTQAAHTEAARRIQARVANGEVDLRDVASLCGEAWDQDMLAGILAIASQTASPTGDYGELIERLQSLIGLRHAFVAKREAMNAAIPDIATATQAEYALYDERFQADNEAHRALLGEALAFAMWAAENNAADALSELQGRVERMGEALEPFAECAATYADEQPDSRQVIEREPGILVVNLGDLRRAREASTLARKDGEK